MVEGGKVGSQGIIDWTGGEPPEVSEGHHSIWRPHEGRDVLRRMSRRFNQANGRGEFVPFGSAILPIIALVDGPDIVETRTREKGRVQRMVWMVVGEDHISDRFG